MFKLDLIPQLFRKVRPEKTHTYVSSRTRGPDVVLGDGDELFGGMGWVVGRAVKN